MTTTSHKLQSNYKKNLIQRFRTLFLIFIPLLVTTCQLDEEASNQQNQISSIYKKAVLLYLNDFKINASKEQNSVINQITISIDTSSLKKYDLKTTEKLLIADLKTVKGYENATKTKIIFYLNNNLIVRSDIIVFKDQNTHKSHDKIVLSILNQKENIEHYSGAVSFLNIFTKLKFSNEYENGILKVNAIVYQRKKDQKNSKSNSDCYYYYIVTTYPNGYQSMQYLYTDCPPPCSGGGGELYKKTSIPCDTTIGGGGGSGAGSGTNETPIFPYSPSADNTFDFTDRDGVFTRYKFNIITNNWDIVFISLPAIVIKKVPEAYARLSAIEHPRVGEKVLEWNGLLYTFEANNSWTGVPATDAIIAQNIEDNIDDSKLDPCTKGVFQKIKTTTVCDFSEILSRLGAVKSVYKTIIKSEVPPNLQPAQTVWNSTNNYTLYISTDYVGKTKLFIAALMLHEMVHAHFISLYDEFYNSNPPNKNAYDDFPALFHYYVTLKRPSSLNAADFHHQQIAESYVAGIARALQEYQTGVPVEEGISPEQIYSDLAWGTLQQTPIFDSIYPIGNQNRQRILNRYQTEQTGYPAGQGTPQVQTPLGQPCN